MMSSVCLLPNSERVTHTCVFIKHSKSFEINLSLSFVSFVKGRLKLQFIMDTTVDENLYDTCNN